MKIKSYGASDIGLSRLNNEDVWAQMLKERFFILADGMGGHKAGEVAANETVIYLCSLIKRVYETDRSIDDWITIFDEGIQKANAHVLELAAKNAEHEGMGTTLCLTLITDHTLIYAHVGDSRLYRIRKGRITQLTRDHSLRDDLIAKGELDESLALSFPYKNVITRAIGTDKRVRPEIDSDTVQPDDLYFLCSDGLTDTLSDAQIHDIIEDSSTLQKAADTLILEAKKAGGSDNITIILFQVN